MDSMYHSTVMHRPADDDDERLRRERILDNASTPGAAASANTAISNVNATANANANANAAAAAGDSATGATLNNSRPFDARSPTQSDFHHPPPPPPPFSPTNGHPRPQFNSPYHPPTPSPLPMPTPSHPPHSVTASQPYAGDYASAPRDKPTSNYYDPTSDSGERRPVENASWQDAQARTPQVWSCPFHLLRRPCVKSLTSSQSRESYHAYPAAVEPPKFYNGSYTSPVSSTFPPRSPISHAHPPRHSSISQSPSLPPMASPVARTNGVAIGGAVVKQEPAPPPVVRTFPSSMERRQCLTYRPNRRPADQQTRWPSPASCQALTLHLPSQ